MPKCTALKSRAKSLLVFANNTLAISPRASEILRTIVQCEDDILKVQFFLDPTVIPDVISAIQEDKSILNLILGVIL